MVRNRLSRLRAVWSHNTHLVLCSRLIPPSRRGNVLASTAVLSAEKKKQYISPRIRARNVLRSLDQLYPRVVDCSEPSNSLWRSRIYDALEVICDDPGTSKSQLRSVAVWGPKHANSSELVLALVENTSPSEARVVYKRHAGAKEPLLGSTNQLGHIHWWNPAIQGLNGLRADLAEYEGAEVDAAVSGMLSKDVIVIVVRALIPSLSTSFPLHIVVSHEIFGHEPTRKLYQSIMAAQFPHAFSVDDKLYPKIHLLDVKAARSAQSFFSDNASATPSPSEHQRLIEASNFTQFSHALNRTIADLPRLSAQLSMLSSLRLIELITSQCERRLHEASRNAEVALGEVKLLRSGARNASRKAMDSIANVRGNDVAEQSVQLYLNDLPWWKLPWRADNIYPEISAILGETYGHQLETALSFEAGRFAALQSDQNSAINAVLVKLTHTAPAPSDSVATSSLVTPVLRNSLEQISQSISTRITPSDLTRPIEKRLTHLRSHSPRVSTFHGSSALTHLHRRAQNVLLQSYAFSFGGSFAAWAVSTSSPSWPWLELHLIGALCVVGSMRWAAGRWEKAKAKWWGAWRRVDEGLDRDIEASTGSVLERKVFAKTTRACEALEELAAKRISDIGCLRAELKELKAEADALRNCTLNDNN
ncbi:uncharacterized protein EI90DRAFT_3058527 [Cantharellus anzutake]|uniref:uncharacterized protein n=1 Tax=Cantharellus anzutake TaxID=1750568 RepID=UPI001908ADBE|nr:uncharacterized protein EI90DRAFT_3058527 [Cantharellus anzutake]KAF8331094.1 hypothetical protein EI90DRAFT_3058527 [Cantharellus anzutake]